MKYWSRIKHSRKRNKRKQQAKRRPTQKEILALHEQWLDSIRTWNPDDLCHWCHKPFGKRLSPVTNSGFWFHYPCCHEFLELQQLQKAS